MRDEQLYLSDILEAITDIGEFVGTISHDEFIRDRKTQSAVVRQFEIIGEAIKHVAPQLTQQYPQISWKDISAMRNIFDS